MFCIFQMDCATRNWVEKESNGSSAKAPSSIRSEPEPRQIRGGSLNIHVAADGAAEREVHVDGGLQALDGGVLRLGGEMDYGSGRQLPMIELRGGVQLKRTLLMLDAPIRDLDESGIERDGGGETVPGPDLETGTGPCSRAHEGRAPRSCR